MPRSLLIAGFAGFGDGEYAIEVVVSLGRREGDHDLRGTLGVDDREPTEEQPREPVDRRGSAQHLAPRGRVSVLPGPHGARQRTPVDPATFGLHHGLSPGGVQIASAYGHRYGAVMSTFAFADTEMLGPPMPKVPDTTFVSFVPETIICVVTCAPFALSLPPCALENCRIALPPAAENEELPVSTAPLSWVNFTSPPVAESEAEVYAPEANKPPDPAVIFSAPLQLRTDTQPDPLWLTVMALAPAGTFTVSGASIDATEELFDGIFVDTTPPPLPSPLAFIRMPLPAASIGPSAEPVME